MMKLRGLIIFLMLANAPLTSFAKEVSLDVASSTSTDSPAKAESTVEVKSDTKESSAAGTVAAKDDTSAVATAPQKESEIPLKLEEKKIVASTESMGYRLMLSFGVIILLGGGALYFIKKYAKPKVALQQMQIKILTQHHLGPKRSLAVVRIAGESILIGITDHSINAIKTLSLLDDEIPDEVPKQFSMSKPAKGEIQDDEFTMAGIQDMVKDKLKNMRSLS